MPTKGSGLFASADYRRIFLARAISSGGTYMQIVGASWYAYSITGRATASGLLAALALGPTIIGGPIGGILADRYDPRRLAILLCFLQAIPPALLAAFAGFGYLPLWLLYALVLVMAIPSGLNSPVMAIVMSHTVPAGMRQAAVARTSLIFNTSRIAGALGGGFAVHWMGIAPPFAINAATYIVSMIVLTRISLVDQPGNARHVPAHTEESVPVSAWAIPVVRYAAVGMAAFFILIAPVEHLMPIVAREHGLSAAAVGILVGAIAVGAMLGNPFSSHAVSADNRRKMIIAGLLVAAGGMTILATTPRHGIAVDITGAILIGFGWELLFVSGQSTVVVDVPAAIRGRFMGYFFVLLSGATSLGALLLGIVIDRQGMPWTFLMSVTVAVTAAVILLIADRRTAARAASPPPLPPRHPVR